MKKTYEWVNGVLTEVSSATKKAIICTGIAAGTALAPVMSYALDVAGVVDEIEAGAVSAGLIIGALLLFGVAIFVGFFLAGKVRRG